MVRATSQVTLFRRVGKVKEEIDPMNRAAILALAISFAAFGADSKDVNKTVALSRNGFVSLETHKGSIQVTTWDRQDVEIHARIEQEPGTTMDRRRFDGTDVLIDSSADSVHIKTHYPDFSSNFFDDNGTNPEVRYTIKMPKTARLIIRDHRSDTQVDGLQGALDLTTHRGTVHVRGLSGGLRVETHRGDIHVDFAAFTANSSVTTYRGTVELSMPKGSHFDLESNSDRRGTIATDFEVMTRTIGRRGEGVHGKANGGGPVLHLETSRGEISLHGK
jgi:Putative adhesin